MLKVKWGGAGVRVRGGMRQGVGGNGAGWDRGRHASMQEQIQNTHAPAKPSGLHEHIGVKTANQPPLVRGNYLGVMFIVLLPLAWVTATRCLVSVSDWLWLSTKPAHLE